VFFATPDVVGDMLLLKDTTGRRIYNTVTDLAAALRVSKIVEVPVMRTSYVLLKLILPMLNCWVSLLI